MMKEIAVKVNIERHQGSAEEIKIMVTIDLLNGIAFHESGTAGFSDPEDVIVEIEKLCANKAMARLVDALQDLRVLAANPL